MTDQYERLYPLTHETHMRIKMYSTAHVLSLCQRGLIRQSQSTYLCKRLSHINNVQIMQDWGSSDKCKSGKMVNQHILLYD